jgi:hypothetical protein
MSELPSCLRARKLRPPKERTETAKSPGRAESPAPTQATGKAAASRRTPKRAGGKAPATVRDRYISKKERPLPFEAQGERKVAATWRRGERQEG